MAVNLAGRSVEKQPVAADTIDRAGTGHRQDAHRHVPDRPALWTRDGLPLNATHIGNVLNSRRGEFPIAKLTSHDLRRTAITKLAELGVAIDTVAAVAGHAVGGPQVRTLVHHYVKTDFVDAKTQALAIWDARLRQLVSSPAPAIHALAAE